MKSIFHSKLFFCQLLALICSFSLSLCCYIDSALADTFVAPANGTRLTYCEYGDTTCATSNYHTGQDYDDNSSLDIKASNGGKVVHKEIMWYSGPGVSDHGMGTNLIIEHVLDDNSRIYTSYSHLASVQPGIDEGACVTRGEVIATMGGSGYGNSDYWARHLHFEFKKSAVTGSPWGGSYWGYTPTDPGNYGYANPYSYIGLRNAKVHPDCGSGYEVYDFWRKADPLYADPNSDIWNPNFDAQYKVVNNGSEDIYIDSLALAVHDADDNYLFDLSDPNTGQARFYDNVTLSPGESLHFVFSVGYIHDPGTYKLVAKAQIDGTWHHLASQDFVMQEAPDNVITELTSGQQVSGSVSQGDWKQYKITASSSDTELQVNLTNLSADVDLYVRKDLSPTQTSYDCRPYNGGTASESCTLPNSGETTWYISVYGYRSGSFDLEATLAGQAVYPAEELSSGQQANGSVGLQGWKNYQITASSSDTELQVDLTNLSADVDLYVRKDLSPTQTAYDCRPYNGGTSSESCTLPNSGETTWYISVYGYQAGSFDLMATLSGIGSSSVTELTSGQQVSDSAGYHAWKKYKIVSSSSDTELQVAMSGLSADLDLYVQQGAEPTLSSYACRPYLGSTSSESCTLPNSGETTWYISVYGYQAGSFDLMATLSGIGSSSVTELTSGQQVSDSAGYHAWKKYKIVSSSSDTELQVAMSGLSADMDLYVQQGAEPTLSSYACRPYNGGTSSESCTLPNSGETTWYISVYGYQAGSFDLEATLSGSGSSSVTELTSGQQVSDSAGYHAWKKYKIVSSSSDTELQVDMSGLSADLDLYVQQGAEPTLTSYDCRPYHGNTASESCTLTNSGATEWYISVYGYQAGNFDLEATLSGSTSSNITILTSDEQVSDFVQYQTWANYKIEASSSDTQLLVDLTNLSADVDLYVKQGAMPTLSSYDCRPYMGSTLSESCTLTNTGNTDWYISVYGYQAGSYDLKAMLSQSVTYGYPHQGGYSISQGNNTGSHTGIGAYAYDFAMPVGTSVVASAGGVVSRIKQDSTLSGCDSAYANDANYVVIDHGNGESTLYLHLQADSVTVNVGSSVSKGQVIGQVGLSGWVCGAHLHFQVQQTCSSWWCQSVPVTFVE
ncbi:MAG: pre-peptidase C-terminal domain-containing protein [Candidatus Electrothrix scaldis]|nr:MAG: pre-peptidase C-terminal domain-containing protein [Candidatus Electrothrix sp. GW3-3]